MAKKRTSFLILVGPKWKIPSGQNGSSNRGISKFKIRVFSSLSARYAVSDGPSLCHSRPQSHSAYISCVDIRHLSTAVSAAISQDHARWYHFSRPFEEETHCDLTALIVGGKGVYFPYLTD